MKAGIELERNLFGTDGIRGRANEYPMVPELALRLGMAAGHYFNRGDHRHQVVIAKDTRLSGYMIEPSLTAGFISMGMDVVLVGPMPTPAVSMLVRSLRADLGVMISASHNRFDDNGIKLFGPDGSKLYDSAEMAIEALMNSSNLEEKRAPSEKLGRAKRLDDAPGRYIEFVKNSFPKGLRLDGLKIVVDCANGAAYHIAPKVFWELGAEVIAIGVKPDGFNINQGCGSTDVAAMCEMVVKEGAHMGIALDGDADRLIMCDENGQLLNGDQLIGLITTHWRESGQLKGDSIVTTLMTNMGLERYLNGIGINMIRAKVGDRYVIEQMRANNLNIGGEQSGHIILADYSSTGDGIMAALQVLAKYRLMGDKPLSKIGWVFEPFPQISGSVRFKKNSPLEKEGVQKAIKDAEKILSGNGRVVVRKSGTEPLIRVMAEGNNEAQVQQVVRDIISSIEAECVRP